MSGFKLKETRKGVELGEKCKRSLKDLFAEFAKSREDEVETCSLGRGMGADVGRH